MSEDRCLIIGAGPAGLTAAHELSKLGVAATIFEMDDVVGGISRTAQYQGYRFDIGGHRFFTKVDFVRDLWFEILGDDLLVRPRLSRIFYDDKFFDYPLKPMNALSKLGPIESGRIALSYLYARLFPNPNERTFEDSVSNRFGRRLYEIFFKTYTEKVWGIPCSEIEADWATQRIKDLDLTRILKEALLHRAGGKDAVASLIEEFHYPRLGPGMMWERCAAILATRGYATEMRTEVVRIDHEAGRVLGIVVRDADGNERYEPATHLISSMPIRTLMHALSPPPPPAVLEAADRLRYRDFMTIVLIVEGTDLFPDNWIYIHSLKVQVGRIQNFRNWSPEMVPDPTKTSLGLEYFLQQEDELWSMDDADLVALGTRELAAIGLVDGDRVVDGCVVRMPKAYPVYDPAYKESLGIIRDHLDKIQNLQLVGRNGQHRYNNQDHSMVTAIYAARNIAGEVHDVWDVNVDEEYHETLRRESTDASEPAVTAGSAASGDRAVPQRAPHQLDDELIAAAFARYDPVALGGAIGIVSGVGLFLATAVLLAKGGPAMGANLLLLANFFIGYEVSWVGAVAGLAEGGVGGFVFGSLLATAINMVTGLFEAAYREQIALVRAMNAASGDAE